MNYETMPLSEVAKLSFEDRMQRRAARRATPEFRERIEAIKRRRRHREIWRAIRVSGGAA